jgi:hypothetical protein
MVQRNMTGFNAPQMLRVDFRGHKQRRGGLMPQALETEQQQRTPLPIDAITVAARSGRTNTEVNRRDGASR